MSRGCRLATLACLGENGTASQGLYDGDLTGRIGTLNFAELVDTPACTATLPTGTDYIHRMMVATLGMA
jgi:hypothetical protein